MHFCFLRNFILKMNVLLCDRAELAEKNAGKHVDHTKHGRTLTTDIDERCRMVSNKTTPATTFFWVCIIITTITIATITIAIITTSVATAMRVITVLHEGTHKQLVIFLAVGSSHNKQMQ